MTRVLLALLAGGAAYLLTREPLVGLLVAAGGWFLWQPRRTNRDGDFTSVTTATSRTPREGGVEVVCKQVTAERQEWVSVRTGRLYDVLAPNGPADAEPGDRAYVVTTPTGYSVSKAESAKESVSGLEK